MKAKDIMTEKVISVKEDLSVRKLAELFVRKKISGAPVVDGRGRLKGLVLEESLIFQDKNVHLPTFIAVLTGFIALDAQRYESEMKKITARTVKGIMEKNPVVIFPETEVSEIATMIVEKNTHYFPVVKGAKLVGVVTKKDIIRFIAAGKL